MIACRFIKFVRFKLKLQREQPSTAEISSLPLANYTFTHLYSTCITDCNTDIHYTLHSLV